MKYIALLLLAFFLIGCGTAKTVVLEPHRGPKMNPSSIKLEHGDSTINVDGEMVAAFEEELSKLLFTEGPYTKGEDLIISYAFLSADKGDRLKRYLSGGIGNWGEGSLVIQVTFLDINRKELAKINTDAEIGSGFYGGGYNNIVRKSAKEIVEFLSANF